MDTLVMQYWLRFALPIGSAFVVAVTLDNVIAFDALLKEIILATADEAAKDSVDSYNAHSDQYPVLYVFIRAVLALGLWAILVKAPKTLLFLWIIAAVAMDSLRHGNLKMIFDAISSFNIYLLVIMPTIRVYLYLIFIEVARIIEKQKEPRLLVGSYDGADEDLQSLVPIGYDSVGIWRYYIRFPVIGSRLLLTVDLVWTFVALPAVKAALGGFFGLLITLIGSGLDGYALVSIAQKQPSGVVLWRFLYLIFIILIVIAFGSEFMDTKKNPSEQGIISTLTLAFMLIYKCVLYWFSSGIEDSLGASEFSANTTANNQLAQIEAAPEGYQVSDVDWGTAPMTPMMPGRVIITEIDGSRSGRVSRASHNHSGWGSQSGIGVVGSSREGIDSRSGWGSQSGIGIMSSSREGMDSRSGWGSQSAVSDSREGGDSRSVSGWDSQSQSVRTSREAISTVSSVSGWTSGRDSQ